MTAVVSKAESGRQRAVLRVLQTAPGALTISQLARTLQVHPNTVRFHLAALMTAGLVDQVPAQPERPGRPAHQFRAVRRMDPAGLRHYQLLAGILADYLSALPEASARAVDAGRDRGAALALRAGTGTQRGASRRSARKRLVSLLEELGFDPEMRAGAPQEIGLRHCPFLEVAQARAQVVCPVHLGLMRGALEAWNAPVTVDSLEPFAEPDLCVARLSAPVPVAS